MRLQLTSRTTRLLVTAASLLVLAPVLASCSSDERVPYSAPPAQSIAGLSEKINYVAMGDSYSAGPMVTTVRADPSGCVRSTDNYPAFLAGWLGVESYTDVTCSAADTSDLSGSQTLIDGTKAAPQLTALTAETDLVTLGIGGNDFGIFSSLVSCAPGGARACPAGMRQRLLGDALKVQPRVAKAVREIARRAPDAAVYVVGYPQVLPTTSGCPAVPLPPVQLQMASDVATRLNASVRAGAEAAGATYVDLEQASAGHDVCAGKDAWINGPRMRPGIAAPFHPVLAGMRGAAETIFHAISGQDAPASDTATPPADAMVHNTAP